MFRLQDESISKQLEDQQYLSDIRNVHSHYSTLVLKLSSGARAVICNGRIIGPLDKGEEFTSEDFSLLERYSQSTYGDKLFKTLIKSNLLEEEDDEYGKEMCNFALNNEILDST